MFRLSAFADEISPDPQEQVDVLDRCGGHCQRQLSHRRTVAWPVIRTRPLSTACSVAMMTRGVVASYLAWNRVCDIDAVRMDEELLQKATDERCV